MSAPETVPRCPDQPLRAELRTVTDTDPTSLDARTLLHRVRAVLEAVSEAPGLVGKLTEDELSDLAAGAIALTRAGESLAVAATVEAVDRGTTQTSVSASTAQWVRARGPGMEPGQAGRIAEVAERIAARSGLVREGPPLRGILAEAAGPATDDTDVVPRLVEADPSGRLLLAEVVASGAINVRAAHRAIREAPRVQLLIPSASTAEVISWFLALGDEATDRDRRMLTRRLVARYDADQLSRDETTEQRREHLTFHDLPCGMVRMIADLSRGHAALIKQAIGTLSAPQPGRCADADEPRAADARDERPAGKRRADALTELIDKGADHLPGSGNGSVTGHAKAVVTVDIETLRGAFAHGNVPGAGITPYGDLLDRTTVRQIACDAGIIPAVLGARGQPLDVGREQRLFTGSLRTAVVLRDRQCTFPGCDRPPDWCQIHHLLPWWAGGPTGLDNGALLCERHHTIVHRDGLTGALVDDRVEWDLTPGLLHQWPRAG